MMQTPADSLLAWGLIAILSTAAIIAGAALLDKMRR
jgi:hypothetical protein